MTRTPKNNTQKLNAAVAARSSAMSVLTSGKWVRLGGGEGGIRTLGTPEGLNGFRDRPVRPLRHLSAFEKRILIG